jgi:hypothetical protein
MGDVDDLVRLVPVVDRQTIKWIYEELDDPTPTNVASMLETLAARGKVPQHDYREMIESNRRQFEMERDEEGEEKINLAIDDPLDEPPDADPNSEANARRGRRARQWAKEHAIDKRAQEVAANGTLDQLIELMNAVDKWANEALLSPELNGLGGTRFKTALNTLADGFRGLMDEHAATGDVQALRAARAKIDRVRNPELRDGLEREALGYERLATANGDEFEQAKSWALDEGLAPGQMLTKVDNARYHFDLTYEQQERLEASAKEWLEEYRELQASAEG